MTWRAQIDSNLDQILARDVAYRVELFRGAGVLVPQNYSVGWRRSYARGDARASARRGCGVEVEITLRLDDTTYTYRTWEPDISGRSCTMRENERILERFLDEFKGAASRALVFAWLKKHPEAMGEDPDAVSRRLKEQDLEASEAWALGAKERTQSARFTKVR